MFPRPAHDAGTSPTSAPSRAGHFYWPRSLRTVMGATASVVREIATGIDTWSAIRHGVIPLDDRPLPERGSGPPHDPRRPR